MDEVFVVVTFHEYEPMGVYGPFEVEDDAREWACDWTSTQGCSTAYAVHAIMPVTGGR